MKNPRPADTVHAAKDTTSDTETVFEAVIDAIAEAESVSPVNLEPPLGDVVDPEALATIITSMAGRAGGSPGHVQFTYTDYTVTVTADKRVYISEFGR